MNQEEIPLWLRGENVAYYDNDQFAIILIDNKYFPIGKFSGHLSISGFIHLKDAKALSKLYYEN